MNTFLLIPFLCTAYVLYQVWIAKNNMTMQAKVIWSVFSVVFNLFTLIAFLIAAPNKKM